MVPTRRKKIELCSFAVVVTAVKFLPASGMAGLAPALRIRPLASRVADIWPASRRAPQRSSFWVSSPGVTKSIRADFSIFAVCQVFRGTTT